MHTPMGSTLTKYDSSCIYSSHILCDMMYIIQLGAQVPHTMQLNCGQSNGFYSIPYII